MLMIPGPMITSMSAGKRQNISGKRSFTATLAAASSALALRLARSSAEYDPQRISDARAKALGLYEHRDEGVQFIQARAKSEIAQSLLASAAGS